MRQRGQFFELILSSPDEVDVLQTLSEGLLDPLFLAAGMKWPLVANKILQGELKGKITVRLVGEIEQTLATSLRRQEQTLQTISRERKKAGGYHTV